MGASGWVHVEVERVIRETDAAFKVLIDDEEVWLPKSQIADADDYKPGDTNCTMSITEWIAKEKGIEHDG